jgi:lipoprotein-anchoring transpeptidase ErfK/SrfK
MLIGLVLLGAVIFQILQTPVAPDSSSYPPVKKLERQIAARRARGLFILIDTASNRLYLRRGDKVLMEAVCSTGSGAQLVAGEKHWTFRTPRGEFRIVSKTRNPWWRKPDWAYLEEGEPVPKRESDRFERGVLGEYALGLGHGYFIHGTLYTRLLGTNVTHGCIRLGRKELAYLARHAPIGTRVFIY